MSTAETAGSGIYINHKLADPSLTAALLHHVDVGVCVVDGDLNVVAINTLARDILDFPADLIRPGLTLEALIRFNAARGDFGEGSVEDMVRERLEVARTVEAESFEYTQADGSPILVKRTLLPDGGFITTYSGKAAVKHVVERHTEPTEAPREAKPAAMPGEIDILIAEDDEDKQQILSAALEGTDYSFRFARNGAEALGMYRALSPRAMLMNVAMPRISGLEVAGAVRNGEADTGGHIPIIALSADSTADAREQAITAGMDDYLAYPLGADDLRATVVRWMEGDIQETAAPEPDPVTDDEPIADEAPDTQQITRVLLAEDNEANHEVFLELMEDGPFEVTGVWNGRDAVVQFIVNPSAYDVILMDMSMPVMTGIEATEAIRTHERVNNLEATPIIGISAAPTSELRHKAEKAGVDEYLVKPVNVDELLACLASFTVQRNVQDLKETAQTMVEAVETDEAEPVLSIADLARKYRAG